MTYPRGIRTTIAALSIVATLTMSGFVSSQGASAASLAKTDSGTPIKIGYIENAVSLGAGATIHTPFPHSRLGRSGRTPTEASTAIRSRWWSNANPTTPESP